VTSDEWSQLPLITRHSPHSSLITWSLVTPRSSLLLHPSSFILLPSSFIPHPSSFFLHPHPSSLVSHKADSLRRLCRACRRERF
jgi:hypothetical protein